MVKVSVEVCSRATRFRITVCAESVERALSLARAHYPSCKVSLVFPIEPEDFFVNSPPPFSEAVHLEHRSRSLDQRPSISRTPLQ